MPASVRELLRLELGDQPLDLLLDRRQADQLLELGHRVADLDLGDGQVGHSSPSSVAESRTPCGVTVVPAVQGRWLRRSSSSLAAIGLTATGGAWKTLFRSSR